MVLYYLTTLEFPKQPGLSSIDNECKWQILLLHTYYYLQDTYTKEQGKLGQENRYYFIIASS